MTMTDSPPAAACSYCCADGIESTSGYVAAESRKKEQQEDDDVPSPSRHKVLLLVDNEDDRSEGNRPPAKEEEGGINASAILSMPASHSPNESRLLAFSSAAGVSRPPAAAGYQENENTFPFLLYKLLEDAEPLGFDNLISWIEGGKSFKIHNRKHIAQVLPTYFSSSQYRSFHRQLNLYNFCRDDKTRGGGGVSGGSYSHRDFRRGYRKLCHLITRRKQRPACSKPAVVATGVARTKNKTRKKDILVLPTSSNKNNTETTTDYYLPTTPPCCLPYGIRYSSSPLLWLLLNDNKNNTASPPQALSDPCCLLENEEQLMLQTTNFSDGCMRPSWQKTCSSSPTLPPRSITLHDQCKSTSPQLYSLTPSPSAFHCSPSSTSKSSFLVSEEEDEHSPAYLSSYRVLTSSPPAGCCKFSLFPGVEKEEDYSVVSSSSSSSSSLRRFEEGYCDEEAQEGRHYDDEAAPAPLLLMDHHVRGQQDDNDPLDIVQEIISTFNWCGGYHS